MNEIKEKECYFCHSIKPIERFYKTKNSPDGRYTICHDCVNLKQRVKNKETERKCRKCLIIKPIEEFGRHANNSKKKICAECEDKYIPIEDKQRNAKTKQRHRESDINYKRKNFIKLMFGNAKARARLKNLPFNLELSDITIPEFCPALGIKIERGIGGHTDNSPSLDKIIPEKGYIKGNIKVISFRANSLKRDGTAEELEKIAKYIRENS